MSLSKRDIIELNNRFRERSQFIARATIDTIIQETDNERQRRIERLLKPANYNQFFNYYFGKDTAIPLADCNCAWYHTDIYKELYKNDFITLFNLVFRGGAKSTHANLGYIVALKQSEKAKFFLVVGANELRAAMLLQDLQVQFEHNARLIKDFGQQKVYGSWSDGMFETTDKCTFMALGIDQPFRGLRANGYRLEYVSIDDVEDKKRAQNRRLTREYIDKITGDIQAAFSTRSERTIINNNYFVENGLIDGLLAKKGFDIKKIDTKQNQILRNKYAAVYLVNLTNKYYDQIRGDNIQEWQPSWPERFSHEACLRKIEQYAHDKETLSGEFYNTPINVGKRIREEMIHMVKPLALEKYTLIVENWDLAYSDSACYKAKATIGVHDGKLTVLDVFCRQCDIQTAMDYHFTRAKKVLRQTSALVSYYDASVAQEAVYEQQWLQAGRKHNLFFLPLPQKSHVDKYIKIDTTLIGVLTSGTLAFSEELENNPDWAEAKAQMLNFEKGGKYPIDFPDALSDAILKAQELIGFDANDEVVKPVFGLRRRGNY